MATKREQINKNQPPTRASLDGDYPGLAGLSYWIGYLEQALAILSEPLLIGCSALAVIDFITGGGLLSIPAINYLWAAALAIAVTACFIVTWRRCLRAFSQNRYFAAIGLALMGVGLGVVDWTAVAAQSLEQAMHVNLAQSLIYLGFSVFWITNIRAAVAISMAVVVAISNHTAITTAQAPKRRLAVWDKMLNKIAPVVNVEQEIEQPFEQETEKINAQSAQIIQNAQSISTIVRLDVEPIERVKQVLNLAPAVSDRELGRLTNLAPATAKKYKTMLESF